LDGVASGEAAARGAFYGYQDTKRRPTTTAIGLLCRMYTGWPRKHPALEQGTAYLSQLGPSKTDMYFNFYASQALHHYGRPRWDRWNNRLRDYLVSTQARTGHEAGSWHFDDPHGRQGGRVYTTAICTMILQVYYRYCGQTSGRSSTGESDRTRRSRDAHRPIGPALENRRARRGPRSRPRGESPPFAGAYRRNHR
jgi:hypothetical protein